MSEQKTSGLLERVTKGIVLIGTTQSGKSTLVNMLLTDDLKVGCKINRIFETGGVGLSCTKSLSSGQINYDKFTLEVLDTPGLDDTEGRDTLFFGKIITKFKSDYQLHQIILVINMNSVISKNIKSKFLMYQQIFGELFKTNLMLVLSKFTASEEHTLKQRGISIDSYLNEVNKNYSDALGFKVKFYPVNSEPENEVDVHRCLEIKNELSLRLRNAYYVSIASYVQKPMFLIEKSNRISSRKIAKMKSINDKLDQLKRLKLLCDNNIEAEAKIEIKAIGLVSGQWFCCYPRWLNTKVETNLRMLEGDISVALEDTIVNFDNVIKDLEQEVQRLKERMMDIKDMITLIEMDESRDG